MMKTRLCEIAGIGVFLHWSFWILPAWILFGSLTGGEGLMAGLSAVTFVFSLFGCVVLHEVGHALMARRFRIETRDITLYPIGGVARLERMPTNPMQEMAIALAGPAVNVVIAAILFAVLWIGGAPLIGGSLDLLGGDFLTRLMWVNIALVVFNLLPAFPMDGGRVLRAFLALRLPYTRATTIAARVGQGLAVLLGLVGLLTGGTLILVALFVFLAAQAELTNVRMQTAWADRRSLPPLEPVSVRPRPFLVDEDGIIWMGDVRSRVFPNQETRRITPPRPSWYA